MSTNDLETASSMNNVVDEKNMEDTNDDVKDKSKESNEIQAKDVKVVMEIEQVDEKTMEDTNDDVKDKSKESNEMQAKDVKVVMEIEQEKGKKKESRSERKRKSRAERTKRERSGSSAEAIATDIRKNLTCCNTWGIKSIALFLIIMAVGAFHFIVLILYAGNEDGLFTNLSRDFVPYFLIFFIQSILLLLWLLLRWKVLVRSWITAYYKLERSRNKKKQSVVRRMVKIYKEHIGLNGKYYLWKIHLYEFIENWIQFANLNQVFLCTLPIEWTTVLCCFMIFEASYRIIVMGHRIYSKKFVTVKDRDFQLILDISIDFMFLTLPLLLTYFIYDIKLTAFETLRIVFMPTLSLLGKVRSLTIAVLYEHTENRIVQRQAEISKHFKRNRHSLFRLDYYGSVETLQNKYFPKYAKLTVLVTSFIYACTILVVLMVQLAKYSTVEGICNEMLHPEYNIMWKEGCIAKVAYCQHLFKPSCDCASIKILKHNLTRLPNNTVKMTSLRSMTMQHGPLEKVPKAMDKLTKLTRIDFGFNELVEFNVNMTGMDKLTQLDLKFNRIKSIHKSLWTHQTLTFLSLSSNVGLSLPDEEVHLPNLYFLDLRNNTYEVPKIFVKKEAGTTMFPAMKYLFINCKLNEGKYNTSNIKGQWPDVSFKAKLLKLGVSFCNLKSIPEWITEFDVLFYLDARGNDIPPLSPLIQTWIKEKNIEAYFSNNTKICLNGAVKENYCEKLCSDYCYSRNHDKNNFCDDSCNSEECKYDYGNCAS